MIYTACIQDEDRIQFFGQGTTEGEALDNFISEALDDHCEYYGIEAGEKLKIVIHETRYSGDWDEEEESLAECEAFQWILGTRVRVHYQLYEPK
jgi:hypothetical protein